MAQSSATYLALVPAGLESVLEDELKTLGFKGIKRLVGAVRWQGDLESLYRAHLELRTPVRILRKEFQFPARTVQELYDRAVKLPWHKVMTPERTISIECVVTEETEEFRHTGFLALKVKDAIADFFRNKVGRRPDVDKEDAHFPIQVYLNDGYCEIGFDATGVSLHERGYRQSDTGAPLKENLAAGMIKLTGWTPDRPFVDLMCGSGTLPIEAALMACNIAPGFLALKRNSQRFKFLNWPDFDPTLWQKLLNEVEGRIIEKAPAPIFGSDHAATAIRISKLHGERAGVHRSITWTQCKIEDFVLPPDCPPGVVILNPPYGLRLETSKDLTVLYKTIGDVFKNKFKGWDAFVFTGEPELLKSVGLKSSGKIPLFNGPIECRLAKYQIY